MVVAAIVYEDTSQRSLGDGCTLWWAVHPVCSLMYHLHKLINRYLKTILFSYNIQESPVKRGTSKSKSLYHGVDRF